MIRHHHHRLVVRDGLGIDDLNTGGTGGTAYHNQNRGTDILIGDDTTYDANTTALLALIAEWGRTDITRTQKITDLTSVQSAGQEARDTGHPAFITFGGA